MAEEPEAVVVATGARPKARPFGGDYGPPGVVTAWQVLTGQAEVAGPQVLLIDLDGHHQAASTAELLADRGYAVHIVTPALFVGSALGPLQDTFLTRRRLAQKGVRVTTDTAVFEIQGLTAKAVQVYSGQFVEIAGQQTIVLAAGAESVDDLYHQLKGRVSQLYRIGDCVAPRKTDMAILEGHRVGREI